MADALYDVRTDPQERVNLIADPAHEEVASDLRGQVETFFETYSVPAFDLWSGGSAKSNVTYSALWQDAWGDDWKPVLKV